MNRRLALFALVALTTTPVVAQDQEVDQRRVEEIMVYVDARADAETDGFFGLGDYPKAIQLQRIRYECRPWDGGLASDLVWMLGNVEYDAERLAVAIRFKNENPEDPDRGLFEAQAYWEWKMYARIPAVLEEDILQTPAPHRNVFSLLSNAYSRLGYDKDVVRVLDVALRAYPNDGAFVRNRARAIQRMGG